jgi:hypothetical protein
VAPDTAAVPSPKSQEKEYGEVPPDAVAETLTAVPTVPVAGTVGVTVRGSGLVVIVAEAEAITPFESVALTFTV